MLWWVAVQLRSLMYKRKKRIQGILEKKMTSQNKKNRKKEKKRIQMTSNWQEKMFYIWKLKHTQNKTCHKSQWSTRIISHSLWPNTLVHWSPSWRTEDNVAQAPEASRCWMVCNTENWRCYHCLKDQVSRHTSTLVYARSVYKHLNIVLHFWKIFVVLSEKDDLTYMMLLDIQLIHTLNKWENHK